MTIAVTLNNVFVGSNEAVVVPLDTCFVPPEASAVRESCSRELKLLYPQHSLSSEYEIDSLDKVISKIINAQQP